MDELSSYNKCTCINIDIAAPISGIIMFCFTITGIIIGRFAFPRHVPIAPDIVAGPPEDAVILGGGSVIISEHHAGEHP